jgi:hypothetical protein
MVTKARMVWVVWGVLAAAALAVFVALATGRNEPALGEPLELESPAPAVTLEPIPETPPTDRTTSPAPSPTTDPTTAAATPSASRTTAVVPHQPVLVPDDDDDDDDEDDDDDDDDDD